MAKLPAVSVEREIWVWARRSSVTAITTWPGADVAVAARSTSTTIAADQAGREHEPADASQAALQQRRPHGAAADALGELAWRAASASVIP